MYKFIVHGLVLNKGIFIQVYIIYYMLFTHFNVAN